ncbi:MAG TPA: peptidoglycan-binding domain-containing protein, partial [Candidatus Paceibacterota bacterium]
MRKSIIAIFIIIFIILGGGIYYYFFVRTNDPFGGGSNSDNSFPTSTGNRDLGNGGDNGDTLPTFPSSGDTDGGGIGNTNSGSTNGSGEIIEAVKVTRRISDGPVSGATTFGTTKELNLIVRYIDQDSGNIWDYHPIGDTKERVSQSTILRVKDVLWGNNGQTALLRYSDELGADLKNYVVRIVAGATSTVGSTGYFLPDNVLAFISAPPGDERISCGAYLLATIIRDGKNDPVEIRKLQTFLGLETTGLYSSTTINTVIAFQKNNKIEGTGNVGPITKSKINSSYCAKYGKRVEGTKLAYLSKDTNNSYSISITDFDKKTPTNPYFSNYGEWLLDWPNLNTFIFTTKPSRDVLGFAYTASASVTGKNNLFANLKPLLRNIPGLTVNVNPAGTLALYTRTSIRGLSNYLLDIKSLEERPLPVTTFVRDKCVWDNKIKTKIYCAVPRGTLTGSDLESWYLGLSTEDDIYT